MRITVLAGHYGSGKTQIAVNLALKLREAHESVTLCDLDIVNPYFRTIDCRDVLEKAGVRLISSEYAGTNVELPGLPPEAAAVFDDKSCRAVIDVGGDDRGALVLGRYSARLTEEAEALLVINRYRPMTTDEHDAADICREIENAGRIRFTGIINNSNLGADTTAEDILNTIDFAQGVSAMLGLPVRYTTVRSGIAQELQGKIDGLMPISIYHKNTWRI